MFCCPWRSERRSSGARCTGNSRGVVGAGKFVRFMRQNSPSQFAEVSSSKPDHDDDDDGSYDSSDGDEDDGGHDEDDGAVPIAEGGAGADGGGDDGDDDASDAERLTRSRLRRAQKEERSSILTPFERERLRKTVSWDHVVDEWVHRKEEADDLLQANAKKRRSTVGDGARGRLPSRISQYDRCQQELLGGRDSMAGGRDSLHRHSNVRRDTFGSAVRFRESFSNNSCDHVRRPHLKGLVPDRRFVLYRHRYTNAQAGRTLVYPTLPQPKDAGAADSRTSESNIRAPTLEEDEEGDDDTEEAKKNGPEEGNDDNKGSGDRTEMTRTRPSHRFIIAADTQFGILMDGQAMENPNWTEEIKISRRAVAKINAMRPPHRPLYVCVCGDLVDTESSFCEAMASWKRVMRHWERRLVFEQQVRDFKAVWARLDDDIALVCLCGNHDVGNRPTPKTVGTYRRAFGDDYLAFWVNGTYNVALNNCLFADPSGAPDLFDEQLDWLEGRLKYAREHDASHIFVYGHYPWFLKHEDEEDEDIESASLPPPGWGPPGAKFSDFYFNVPKVYRAPAMDLFRTYDVTACFSGHFHQNVTAKSSWGMDMIVTGPLSMMLHSTALTECGAGNGETNGGGGGDDCEQQTLGMRIVDVSETGFTHKFVPLDDEE